jgi:hypothetical protein
MQEAILAEVEKSNERTQQFIDKGMVVVGVVGSLVLGVFGFFGLSSANEARKLRSDAMKLIKELKERIAEAKKTRQDIADQALAVMTPKLAAIANYGMTMASFANASWSAMSFEDRVRFCQEAGNAIEEAGLGDAANAARSFVLARHGSALYEDGQMIEAAEKFKQSCAVNVMKRPDRPFNLACGYIRLSELAVTNADSKARYRKQALDEIEQCLAFATDGSQKNTISKEYYKAQCRRDTDLGPIRSEPRFGTLTS